MEIKIFVVETELKKLKNRAKIACALNLLNRKTDLIRLFGGLTELKNAVGYWLNDKGLIETDKLNCWLIYAEKGFFENEFNYKALIGVLMQIKAITKQQTQAYSINENMLFL